MKNGILRSNKLQRSSFALKLYSTQDHCSVSENPNELLPLTPRHFLRRTFLTAPTKSCPIIPMNYIPYINIWQRLNALRRIFLQRWEAEYVTKLQRRYKWKTFINNRKEGDLVIVKYDLLPLTK